ncbi:unnamed protein product [Blumeria hordei]|uniref:Cell cycle inhibitor Nif1 n=1 Tax=Blumeria hordei TaxID=2867405 RepID=A0A383UL09_BLUHO|nr:unnamed protein product [Blumeria hordei]
MTAPKNMTVHKPSFIDVRSKYTGNAIGTSSSPRGFFSPRLHVVGDITPELSPLDAFAAQSRKLARQLEESSQSGNRVSRLPHLTFTNSLQNGQPEYFGSRSVELPPASPPLSGQRIDVDCKSPRPTSIHPAVCDQDEIDDAAPPILASDNEVNTEGSPRDKHQAGYFDILNKKPASMSIPGCLLVQRPSSQIRYQPGVEQPHQCANSSQAGTHGAESHNLKDLAPPQSPFTQRISSHRSNSTESSDDDCIASKKQSVLLESHTTLSRPSASITSSCLNLTGRVSPSGSDSCLCPYRLSKPPTLNFSRPISRASTISPSLELSLRQASSESSQSFSAPSADAVTKSTSACNEGMLDPNTDNCLSATYLYSKFALPRGKILQRNSVVFNDSLSSEQTTSEVTNIERPTPPSPPTRKSTSSLRQESPPSCGLSSPSLDAIRPSTSSSASSRPSIEVVKTSPCRKITFAEKSPALSQAYTLPMNSPSSIQTKSQILVPSTESTAQEHVEKAIRYHKADMLNKSTYHLRLAARMNHPTGMLLYALACRHGWGMRPNQREGVAWLRKAADEVGLEVADDENLMQAGKVVDMSDLKTKKAQFALSIYELGVSHMNGWGIEQDKALALRCFEIAGSWGDADAMAEAGFCYAQGVGCKKDLKRSAKFYRQAEAKGINMIGNSWIYKAKYNEESSGEDNSQGRDRSDTNSSKDTTKSAGKRNKSRTRGIFSRSKGTPA